jgi:hypothetical protein
MTAPLSQRLRCLITGHDWRRAIGPRHGHYLRCRRCWVTEEEEANPAASAELRPTGLQRQA